MEKGKYISKLAATRIFSKEAEKPQQPFTLSAILFTWQEEDIIEATVKNLFAEGFDRVLLIDNGSEDKTVALAVGAGATHFNTVPSATFSENVKCGAITGCLKHFLAEDRTDRSWWLLADADEFPTGPGSESIREFIARQDDCIRCLGSNFIEHYPLRRPHYISGFHPVDFQFHALPTLDAAVYCEMCHFKHNLLRFDKGRFDLEKIHGGYHNFSATAPLWEAARATITHHFNFRAEQHTTDRLKKLAQPDQNGISRLGDAEYNRRLMRGEAVQMRWYLKRLLQCEFVYSNTGRGIFQYSPTLWNEVAANCGSPGHQTAFWYKNSDLEAAVRAHENPDDFAAWRLTRAMLNKNPLEYLELFEQTAKTALLARHAAHAAACLAAVGRVKEALRLAVEVDRLPQYSVHVAPASTQTAIERIRGHLSAAPLRI